MAKANSDSQNVIQTDVNEDIDISYVAAVFDDVQSAKAAYKVLKDLRREGLFKIVAAAYMEKTDRSKLKVHEYKDWRVEEAIVAGGIVGAVIGIVGGSILIPLAIGAIIGATFGAVHNVQVVGKEWGSYGEALPTGTSALVAIVEDDYVELVEKELTEAGGQKVHSGEIPKGAVSAMEKPAQS